MYVTPIAITQPIWKNVAQFGKDHVRSNPLDGFATSIMKPDSPAAFPACLDFCNNPSYSMSKGHLDNSTFHHCSVSFGIVLDGPLRGIRGVEILELENNCIIATGSLETWYMLIVTKLASTSENPSSVVLRKVLCHILIHLERIGFREMFAKFEKTIIGEDLYYIKEV